MLVANFLIPLLFIIFANINLFCISNLHATKMNPSSVQLGTFVEDNDDNYILRERNDASRNSNNNAKDGLLIRTRRKSKLQIQAFKSNLKAAKRIALLVGLFCFCWLTYFLLVVTNVACGICHPRELTWVGNIINYSSTVTHPLLYGILNANIRREVIKKLQKLLGKCFFQLSNKQNLSNTNYFVSEAREDICHRNSIL